MRGCWVGGGPIVGSSFFEGGLGVDGLFDGNFKGVGGVKQHMFNDRPEVVWICCYICYDALQCKLLDCLFFCIAIGFCKARFQ